MVDLSQRTSSNKRQRSVHLDDATSERLDRAAVISNSTRSQVLDRLIWEDLKLPDDEVAASEPSVRTEAGTVAALGTPRPVVDDDKQFDPGPKPDTEEFDL